MPFRAFDDSDTNAEREFLSVLQKVLMPFRAFDDSDTRGVKGNLLQGHVLMPFRAFDDSDWLSSTRMRRRALCLNALPGIR